MRCWTALAAGVLLVLSGPTAGAQNAPDPFAGKTVRIIIGFDIAGTYGQYAQLAAQHLRRHLAGNPAVVVQQMPGAGGLVAVNHVANVAPRDGTVAMLPPINIVQDALLNSQAKYDPAAFNWIGRLMELVQIGVASETSGLRSLDDAKRRAVSSGGTGGTNPTSMSWQILNALLGTRFNVVSGYKGLPDATLAWERGEVDTVMMNWETAIDDRYAPGIKAGTIRPLFFYSATRLSEAGDLPVMAEMGTTEVEMAFMRIYTVAPAIGRSIALPPGVPADRVAVWRAAFEAMIADPEFKADVEKRKMRLDLMSGAALEAIVRKAAIHPQPTLSGVRAFYDKLAADAR